MTENVNPLTSCKQMARLTLTLIAFLHLLTSVVGQPSLIKNTGGNKKPAASKPSIARTIDSMLALGSVYLYKPGDEEQDLVLAKKLFQAAYTLANSNAMDNSAVYAEYLTSVAELDGKDDRRAVSLLPRLKDSLKAQLQYELGWFYYKYPKGQTGADSQIYYFEKAAVYFSKIKPGEKGLYALRQLGALYRDLGKYQHAEQLLIEAIELGKKVNASFLPTLYSELCYANANSGNYNKALYYIMEGVSVWQKTRELNSAGPLYLTLGNMYREVGEYTKALNAYDSSVVYYFQQNKQNYEMCVVIRHLQANVLRKMHKPIQAIALIKKTEREFPSRNLIDSNRVARAYAETYITLKEYSRAEKNLLAVRSSAEMVARPNYDLLYTMAVLYTDWEKYDRSKLILDTIYQNYYHTFGVKTKAHFHFMLYRADSALGNHFSAMKHLLVNKRLDDSILTESKNRAIRELNAKYDSDSKDREILLSKQTLAMREQGLQLLNRQSALQHKELENTRLLLSLEASARSKALSEAATESERKGNDLLVKQQNIEILEQKTRLQQNNLAQEKLARNIVVASLVVLAFVLLLIFSRYKFQKITNRQLQIQQSTIHEKNAQLSKLLIEKDWLLAELHHRVKNNLHTIQSLLESQSAYLENDALAAILTSQYRVHAMSLIHQKLYSNSNLTTIDMKDYLHELILYLSEAFDPGRKVRFDLKIDPIKLDVTTAVPIGLIVNEAITNSFKYAFDGIETPLIKCSLKTEELISADAEINAPLLELIISDNGIGFPEDFETGISKSLGMNLMRGLTEDLNGRFQLISNQETTIRISFTPRKGNS
jgi:two-component sensor histidine kinase